MAYLTGFSARNKSQDKAVFGLWIPLACLCLLVATGDFPREVAYIPFALFAALTYVHCCPAHFGAFWAKRQAENSGNGGGE